jgi:hypothetical protein
MQTMMLQSLYSFFWNSFFLGIATEQHVMCTTFLPPFATLETQEEGQDTLLLQGRNFSVYNLAPMHPLEHPPPSTQQSD